MTRKTGAWVLFLVGLLLLSLSATPYSRAATVALMTLRLAIVALLSILIVRERWKNRDQPDARATPARPDAGDHLLGRMRRWYYDDKQNPK
jgi:hypothetical protein